MLVNPAACKLIDGGVLRVGPDHDRWDGFIDTDPLPELPGRPTEILVGFQMRDKVASTQLRRDFVDWISRPLAGIGPRAEPFTPRFVGRRWLAVPLSAKFPSRRPEVPTVLHE